LAELLRAALPPGAAAAGACEAWADHVFVTFEGSFILCRSLGDDRHMQAQLALLRGCTAALVAPHAAIRADESAAGVGRPTVGAVGPRP